MSRSNGFLLIEVGIILSRLLLGAIVALLFGSLSFAQDAEHPDKVEALFGRAQTAIEEEGASVDALNQLRADLDDFRQATSDIVSNGSVEARTIEAQVEALGPPPPDGETCSRKPIDRSGKPGNALTRWNC